MKTQKPIVHIRGLRKSFGEHVVLHHIDFDVQPSQVVVIIGPSGSGKSTFLRCCNGLEQPDSGRVEICGHVLSDAGQMLEDVRKAVKGRIPVEFYGRLGGMVPFPDEVLGEIRRVAKGPLSLTSDPRRTWAERLRIVLNN